MCKNGYVAEIVDPSSMSPAVNISCKLLMKRNIIEKNEQFLS